MRVVALRNQLCLWTFRKKIAPKDTIFWWNTPITARAGAHRLGGSQRVHDFDQASSCNHVTIQPANNVTNSNCQRTFGVHASLGSTPDFHAHLPFGLLFLPRASAFFNLRSKHFPVNNFERDFIVFTAPTRLGRPNGLAWNLSGVLFLPRGKYLAIRQVSRKERCHYGRAISRQFRKRHRSRLDR